MTRRRTHLLALAGLPLLMLAACSEEETVVAQAEPPAAVEEEAPSDRDTQTDDALRKLREGAEELSREARERAERALEDAGPALERAGEIAGEIGRSFNEIARQALSDLDKAAAALEKRIAEARGEKEPVTGDPDAVLAPADQLNTDTRAAARAGPAGVGPDYVGVWATDAASCARIDQEAVELFAVITPTTIRRHESVCNFPATAIEDGAATLAASCVAEGEEEERQIVLNMASPDTLTIGRADAVGAAELIRCHLPQ